MHHVEVGELPEAPGEWGMFPLPNLVKFMKWKQNRALELIRAN
jgi:hypothetical protein